MILTVLPVSSYCRLIALESPATRISCHARGTHHVSLWIDMSYVMSLTKIESFVVKYILHDWNIRI